VKLRRSSVLVALLMPACLAATAVVAPAAAVTIPPPTPVPAVFAHPATALQLAAITRPAATALASAKVVRGRFIQRRYLTGLAKPLESSGSFLFAREAGIEWHTDKPFDSQFVLTNTRILQRDEGGVSLEIQASDQPALAVVARVFFALFALDLGSLSQDFDLYGQAGEAGWQLGLKPRAEALASMFGHALVEGAGAVRSVTLEDGNGDRSEIVFQNVTFDKSGLTPDERRRF
jgi:Outer membrane lipoprotein carrier protein LolA